MDLENKKEQRNVSRSFLLNPNITFSTQHENEEVVLVVRAHPLTQISWVLNTFFFSIITVAVNIFLPQVFDAVHITAFNIFAGFMIIAYAWINFMIWYYTVGLVTTERIVDLDFHGIAYKEFSASSIIEISDITTKIGGFFGSVFNYGDVFIKTDGFEQNIEFLDVPHPADIVTLINKLMPK